MQNKFTGDVGDFGKFGLLRFLTGAVDPGDREPNPRLGVVWYLVPDECERGDGRHIEYLARTLQNSERFRDCDPDLWEALHRLVRHERNARCVRQIERAEVLPGAVFYNPRLMFEPYMLRPMRAELRRLWLTGARLATADANLVFLDPDNGLADHRKKLRRDGPKFTYLSDLREFWDCGKSLVVYHHLGMGAPADEQIDGVAARISDALAQHPEVVALRYHRGTARVFFVIAQDDAAGRIVRARANRFLQTCWNQHFTGGQ